MKRVQIALLALSTFVALGVFASSPVGAANYPEVTLSLDKPAYEVGETMTLTTEDNLTTAIRTWTVSDTSGTVWTKVSQDDNGSVWTAVATKTSGGTVTATLVRQWDKATDSASVDYTVNVPKKVIGMSAPASEWNTRIAEVGPGVKARRIFADLTSTGSSQLNLITDAHNAGMMPIVSYKVPNVNTAISGGYDAWAELAAQQLEAFDKTTAVVIWHEPRGDMTPAQYVALQERLVPIFQRGKLKVGPILNGWLLDNRVAEFKSFTSPNLLNLWDWVGMDTYESGTITSPGTQKPAMRVPALVNFLAAEGHPEKQIGVGEYNGFSAQSIADMGEALLSTEQVWFGAVWNSTGGLGVTLSGDRLQAFKDTLADPRALD